MNKHTPGPWCTEGTELDKNGRVCNKVGPDVPYPRTADYPGMIAHIYAKGEGDNGREEQEANARLIAAAPDLLAALEFAYQELETAHRFKVGLINPEALGDARDAIAKARGE